MGKANPFKDMNYCTKCEVWFQPETRCNCQYTLQPTYVPGPWYPVPWYPTYPYYYHIEYKYIPSLTIPAGSTIRIWNNDAPGSVQWTPTNVVNADDVNASGACYTNQLSAGSP